MFNPKSDKELTAETKNRPEDGFFKGLKNSFQQSLKEAQLKQEYKADATPTSTSTITDGGKSMGTTIKQLFSNPFGDGSTEIPAQSKEKPNLGKYGTFKG